MIAPVAATLLRRSATRREHDNLRFYAELAAANRAQAFKEVEKFRAL